MTLDAVVVATARLDDATVRHVAAACDRLHARYVPWTAGDVPTLPEGPALVVAGLAGGERRVPPELMRLCTEAYPGTPLLLLCHEGLATPTVSLHGGQIVLVGPPLTAGRIYGRLAVLRAERRGDEEAPSNVSAVEEPTTRVWTRERLHADVWVASLGCRGLSGGPPYQPVLSTCAEGVTAILPDRPGPIVTDERRLALLALFRTAAPADERLRRLRAMAPDLHVAHFDRRTEEWSVAWPRPDLPLWIHSDQRLPPRWNLATALGPDRQTTLKAYPGDLVVGLTASPGLERDEPDVLEANPRLRDGGHALLAALERRLEAAPRSFAGVVIEVRT